MSLPPDAAAPPLDRDEVAPAAADVALDAEGVAAVELARAAAVEMAEGPVGAHLGARAEGENVVTHAFAAELPGYVGWYWAVTVTRAEGFQPTVAEVVLLPGEGALLAPEWVPWHERVQAGDLSPGDLLPPEPNDPRLSPAYLDSDDPQVPEVAFELGIGRVRVLSRFGRLDAADRWQAGDGGPDTPMAKQAPAHCGSCAFMLPLEGSLRAGFGVCANEVADTDGRVVSVDHGCGAHSEAIIEPEQIEPGAIYDDAEIEMIQTEPIDVEELAIIEAADVEPVDVEPVDVEPAGVEPAGVEPAGNATED